MKIVTRSISPTFRPQLWRCSLLQRLPLCKSSNTSFTAQLKASSHMGLFPFWSMKLDKTLVDIKVEAVLLGPSSFLKEYNAMKSAKHAAKCLRWRPRSVRCDKSFPSPCKSCATYTLTVSLKLPGLTVSLRAFGEPQAARSDSEPESLDISCAFLPAILQLPRRPV